MSTSFIYCKIVNPKFGLKMNRSLQLSHDKPRYISVAVQISSVSEFEFPSKFGGKMRQYQKIFNLKSNI